jgi:archaellum component FlaC
MNKHEITSEVLHELQQAKAQTRIQVLEREIAQTKGNIERMLRLKKQNATPRAPSLDKLQSELKTLQNEVENLTQYLTPFADGKPKQDRANHD